LERSNYLKSVSPSPEVIAKYIHGATYVSLDDSIAIQKQLTLDEMVDITINSTPREELNDDSDNEFVQQNNTSFRIRVKPNWVHRGPKSPIKAIFRPKNSFYGNYPYGRFKYVQWEIIIFAISHKRN
jgi:hypothetical protein